jgi:hypothetical protein
MHHLPESGEVWDKYSAICEIGSQATQETNKVPHVAGTAKDSNKTYSPVYTYRITKNALNK